MAGAGGQALAAACRSRFSRLARSASISAEELSRSARSASSRSARSASCSSVWIPRRRARAHRTAIGATASEGAGWLEPRAYAAPSAMTARHRVSAAESAARGWRRTFAPFRARAARSQSLYRAPPPGAAPATRADLSDRPLAAARPQGPPALGHPPHHGRPAWSMYSQGYWQLFSDSTRVNHDIICQKCHPSVPIAESKLTAVYQPK